VYRVDASKIGLFLFLLAIIGIIASLFVPTKIIEIGTLIYPKSASPLNKGYIGTKKLYDLLQSMGYEVVIADNEEQLLGYAEKGATVLIIAPDKPLDENESLILYNLWSKGIINLIVADENTTSNALLEKYGLSITGKALFQYQLNGYYPYPYAKLYPGIDKIQVACRLIRTAKGENTTCSICKPLSSQNLSSSRFVLRLNWASLFTISCRDDARYIIIGETMPSVVDVNDNGVIDSDDVKPGEYTVYIVGVEVVSDKGSRVIFLSDSFLFTNQAFEMPMENKSYILFVKKLVSNIAENGSRIIIDNSHYIPEKEYMNLPYHPAVLLFFASLALNSFDQMLTKIILDNTFIALLTSLAFVMVLVLAIRYMFGIKEYRAIEISSVDEVSMIAETELRRSVMKKKLSSKEARRAINNLWNMLDYVFRRTMGESLEDIISFKDVLDMVASRLDLDSAVLEKRFSWMYRIYLKAIGRAWWPIVFSWRRILIKYIKYSEEILESMGYTIMRRSGYRGVETILH